MQMLTSSFYGKSIDWYEILIDFCIVDCLVDCFISFSFVDCLIDRLVKYISVPGASYERQTRKHLGNPGPGSSCKPCGFALKQPCSVHCWYHITVRLVTFLLLLT